jgi:signal transduction histidine kinase
VDEGLRVMIDRIMMKRVIDNLVRNATDAVLGARGEAPEIVITTKRRKSKKKLEVEICVVDNGPGIAPEHHPSIFDPYFTTKSDGTGLGLAISKKIVLEHGGRIWLDDQAEVGAAFVLVLPALA